MQCRTGDLVIVRRSRWRVVDVRPFDRCAVITLRGIAPDAPVERKVLTPFDTLELVPTAPRLRFVRRSSWRRVCRTLIAAAAPPGSLRAVDGARIDLLPHQLEPALAVVRGLATRLLLADEVGLGKTVQAALVIAELMQRAVCDRVLILTPAGLRDQWSGELADRFGLRARTVDGPLLRRLATSLPVGTNPWTTVPLALASVDYVKRAEVLPAVAACSWDVVVVDEAHGVDGDSDRHAAVHALARRAPYVLLLTATPHNGDPRAFAALCGIGAAGDAPLAVFRRTRAQVGAGVSRRVHILRVHASADERRAYAALTRYADALHREHARNGRGDPLLALSVLHKRAFSSCWSLAQSVERRLAAIAAADDGESDMQLELPLDDPTGDLVRADEPPPWPDELRMADAAREQRLLAALLSAARAASAVDTKLRRLAILLRRVREPIVVFTEYRDTLAHVRRRLSRPAIVLHGGLARDARADALAAFAGTPSALLLATDAAAEGLNLHLRCRIVVNLELPWNPMRLEQRIGRVDRIGQRRTVHAFHLVAVDTGESRVLERLRRRIAAASADIGAPNPLDGDERRFARLVLRRDE